MWDIFARTSFTAILAKFGQKGLTLQEIIEKDKKIFNSDIEHAFSKDGIEGLKSRVESRKGKYFLKKGIISLEWAEDTIRNAIENNIAKPYDPRKAVGDWGESIVRNAFDLKETEDNDLPDLVSEDGSFYVEVKTTAFNNGGVIKGRQLAKFDEIINTRRFYAFVFHSLTGNMGRTYRTESRLYSALSLKSLYILPFSVVSAHFDASKKKPYPGGDVFVQLNERHAKHIFSGDYGIWKVSLNLSPTAYSRKELHERVRLITRNSKLENRIIKSFDSEVIESAARISESD